MNLPHDPLLSDLAADSDYGRFRSELKARALGNIRRRRRIRQCVRAGALIAVTLALGVLVFSQWLRRVQRPGRRAPAQAAAHTSRPSDHRSAFPAAVQIINEQQLLACFPPGSCTIAEVNGEKMLIFLDPALEKQVMR
jgi:hypothetical protein